MPNAPVSIEAIGVKSTDVIRYVEDKAPRAIGSWRDLGEAEYARAFTAAQTAGWDVVTDLHDGLIKTLAEGGTEADYASLMVPVLQSKGWLGADANSLGERVRLIFDTNLRLSRAAGRWERIQRAKGVMPYLRGVTARDERVRHPPKSPYQDHRAWEGITLPVDHPFWQRHFIPLWFRCRCDVIQMTRSQLAKRGDGITSEAELAVKERALGQTWGAPPMLVGEQINTAVQAANDRRMNGLPMIRGDVIQHRAHNAWASAIASLVGSALSGLLASSN